MTYNKFTTSCLKKYFHTMSNIERNHHSINDYYHHKNFVSLTSQNKNELRECKRILNNLFSRYRNIHNITYNLYFFKDSHIANGLPHSHGDSIFFPHRYFFKKKSRYDRIHVMIHEIIHIFQRLYPFHIHKFFYGIWKLNVFSTRKNFKNIHGDNCLLLRSNPDINNIMYHSKNIYYEAYAKESDSVSFLNSRLIKRSIKTKNNYDSTYDDVLQNPDNKNIQKEHPFETMACILSNHIISLMRHDDTRILISSDLQKWCDSYL